jgi:uncharacterized Rmd1/YagE family protein
MAPRTKTKPKEFLVETKYFGEKIDLKRLQERLKEYRFLNRDHPLVVELVEERYAVLTKFGAVAFWNVGDDLARQFIDEIRPFIRTNKEKDSYHYTDSLTVYTNANYEKITFEEAYLTGLDVEKIKIISYVSAQSVALDRYEAEIDRRLVELGKVVEDLKLSGSTHYNQKSLLKQVGHTLAVKQSTVSSLSLLDKPEAAWEREEIEKLYDHLRDAYELRDRFDILNEKIDFLSENNTTLLDVVSSQRSRTLELIVIWLIVVEIVLFALELLKIFPK